MTTRKMYQRRLAGNIQLKQIKTRAEIRVIFNKSNNNKTPRVRRTKHPHWKTFTKRLDSDTKTKMEIA